MRERGKELFEHDAQLQLRLIPCPNPRWRLISRFQMNASGLSNALGSRFADMTSGNTRWPTSSGWPAIVVGSTTVRMNHWPGAQYLTISEVATATFADRSCRTCASCRWSLYSSIRP
jgi:hypothetical protein